MGKVWKWLLGIAGGVIGAIALLIGAMWLSADVRYGVLYDVMEYVDLNGPISSTLLARQTQALHRVSLVDVNGKPFDWGKSGRAIVWVNEWANWCVPCRMEFPAMAALRHRVGRDKLRIVLISQPRYWEADKRTAKQLGLDFELVTPAKWQLGDLGAIALSKRDDDVLMPENSLMRVNGEGLYAIQGVRDWDSMQWEAVIRKWYEQGLH